MTGVHLFVPINPEPWAIGPVGTARRNGKMSAYVGRNQQLAAYKEAVASEVRDQWGGLPMFDGAIDLKFWFWRQRADYKTPQARTARKNEADGTNLQKATEDALQGVLFANDRDVKHVSSVVMAQGPEVEGCIVIRVSHARPNLEEYEFERLPPNIRAAWNEHVSPKAYTTDSNVWPPPEGA